MYANRTRLCWCRFEFASQDDLVLGVTQQLFVGQDDSVEYDHFRRDSHTPTLTKVCALFKHLLGTSNKNRMCSRSNLNVTTTRIYKKANVALPRVAL